MSEPLDDSIARERDGVFRCCLRQRAPPHERPMQKVDAADCEPVVTRLSPRIDVAVEGGATSPTAHIGRPSRTSGLLSTTRHLIISAWSVLTGVGPLSPSAAANTAAEEAAVEGAMRHGEVTGEAIMHGNGNFAGTPWLDRLETLRAGDEAWYFRAPLQRATDLLRTIIVRESERERRRMHVSSALGSGSREMTRSEERMEKEGLSAPRVMGTRRPSLTLSTVLPSSTVTVLSRADYLIIQRALSLLSGTEGPVNELNLENAMSRQASAGLSLRGGPPLTAAGVSRGLIDALVLEAHTDIPVRMASGASPISPRQGVPAAKMGEEGLVGHAPASPLSNAHGRTQGAFGPLAYHYPLGGHSNSYRLSRLGPALGMSEAVDLLDENTRLWVASELSSSTRPRYTSVGGGVGRVGVSAPGEARAIMSPGIGSVQSVLSPSESPPLSLASTMAATLGSFMVKEGRLVTRARMDGPGSLNTGTVSPSVHTGSGVVANNSNSLAHMLIHHLEGVSEGARESGATGEEEEEVHSEEGEGASEAYTGRSDMGKSIHTSATHVSRPSSTHVLTPVGSQATLGSRHHWHGGRAGSEHVLDGEPVTGEGYSSSKHVERGEDVEDFGTRADKRLRATTTAFSALFSSDDDLTGEGGEGSEGLASETRCDGRLSPIVGLPSAVYNAASSRMSNSNSEPHSRHETESISFMPLCALPSAYGKMGPRTDAESGEQSLHAPVPQDTRFSTPLRDHVIVGVPLKPTPPVPNTASSELAFAAVKNSGAAVMSGKPTANSSSNSDGLLGILSPSNLAAGLASLFSRTHVPTLTPQGSSGHVSVQVESSSSDSSGHICHTPVLCRPESAPHAATAPSPFSQQVRDKGEQSKSAELVSSGIAMPLPAVVVSVTPAEAVPLMEAEPHGSILFTSPNSIAQKLGIGALDLLSSTGLASPGKGYGAPLASAEAFAVAGMGTGAVDFSADTTHLGITDDFVASRLSAVARMRAQSQLKSNGDNSLSDVLVRRAVTDIEAVMVPVDVIAGVPGGSKATTSGVSDVNCAPSPSAMAGMIPSSSTPNAHRPGVDGALDGHESSNPGAVQASRNQSFTSKSQHVAGSSRSHTESDAHMILINRKSSVKGGSSRSRSSAWTENRSASRLMHSRASDLDLVERLRIVTQWDFDVFEFSRQTDGRPLAYITHELFTRFGFLSSSFHTDANGASPSGAGAIPAGPHGHAEDDMSIVPYIRPSIFEAFINKVEREYCFNPSKPSPYHTHVHAADVVQAVGAFLVVPRVAHILDATDALAILLAAVVHDFRHPGVNNTFLMKTGDSLALRYNDESVLENFHVAEAFALMSEPRFALLSTVPVAQRNALRFSMIKCVLATDLAHGARYTSAFRARMDAPNLGSIDADKLIIMQMLLKCADVSHSSRQLSVHEKWSALITEEFYLQGDMERSLGLPISPLCDRAAHNLAKSQIGFIEFVVRPAFTGFSTFCCVDTWMDGLNSNVKHWKEVDAALGQAASRLRDKSSEGASDGTGRASSHHSNASALGPAPSRYSAGSSVAGTATMHFTEATLPLAGATRTVPPPEPSTPFSRQRKGSGTSGTTTAADGTVVTVLPRAGSNVFGGWFGSSKRKFPHTPPAVASLAMGTGLDNSGPGRATGEAKNGASSPSDAGFLTPGMLPTRTLHVKDASNPGNGGQRRASISRGTSANEDTIVTAAGTVLRSRRKSISSADVLQAARAPPAMLKEGGVCGAGAAPAHFPPRTGDSLRHAGNPMPRAGSRIGLPAADSTPGPATGVDGEMCPPETAVLTVASAEEAVWVLPGAPQQQDHPHAPSQLYGTRSLPDVRETAAMSIHSERSSAEFLGMVTPAGSWRAPPSNDRPGEGGAGGQHRALGAGIDDLPLVEDGDDVDSADEREISRGGVPCGGACGVGESGSGRGDVVGALPAPLYAARQGRTAAGRSHALPHRSPASHGGSLSSQTKEGGSFMTFHSSTATESGMSLVGPLPTFPNTLRGSALNLLASAAITAALPSASLMPGAVDACSSGTTTPATSSSLASTGSKQRLVTAGSFTEQGMGAKRVSWKDQPWVGLGGANAASTADGKETV